MNKAKKNLITLLIAIACVLLALMIAVTCVMYSFSSYMDQLLGRGTRVVTDMGDDLEGDYIDFKFNSKEEALANAQAVTQETAEEGIVLLKNEDNALPLSKDAKVTILGYYSWHNNMSGGENGKGRLFYPHNAARLRHRDRKRCEQLIGGAAPAPHDRAGIFVRSAHPDPGRGDLFGRY